MRLNLDVEDYIRAAIMARKTTSRALSKPNSRLIKIEYVSVIYHSVLPFVAELNNNQQVLPINVTVLQSF